MFDRRFFQLLRLTILLIGTSCAPVPPAEPTSSSEIQQATTTPVRPTATEPPATITSTPAPKVLWTDVTETTIGETEGWTNKVELADINGDALVDILFANGGNYDVPGTPEFSQVFLNQGPGQEFLDATEQVLNTPALARVIKVRDVNNDGQPDILMGTTYQTQSQLYLGDAAGSYTRANS